MMKFVRLIALLMACAWIASAEDGGNLASGVVGAKAVKIDPTAHMYVNTTMLIKNGDWVNLWWNITNTTKSDMVFVYSPANVNFTETSPIKYKPAFNDTPAASSAPPKSLHFRLVNMRASYVFAYVKNFTIVALSPEINFENYNEPLQGHLALTGQSSEMRLTWVTRDAEKPQVKWGTVSSNYISVASASTNTYKAEDLCGSIAAGFGWRDPGSIQTAIMKNLVAGKKYFYVFGDSKFGWSQEFSFVAPPGADKWAPVNIIAFGDMGKQDPDGSLEHGSEPGAARTVDAITKEMETNQYKLAVHIGDLAYADGYLAQWDLFFERITPIATKVPYMVCPGNHEFDFEGHFLLNVSDSFGECGVPYQEHFKMPDVTNTTDPFYSIDIGPVHMVLMSTENNFTIGSVQYKFLQKDLASVDRSITPWIIFAGHRPMYIDSTSNGSIDSHQAVAKALRVNIEPLLYKYKVDLAWWGHHHSYQRTCPVFNEKCDNQGTTHVVMGMAGMALSQNLMDVKPEWLTLMDVQNYGYTKLRVDNKTLHMQYMRNGGIVGDTITLSSRF